MKECSHLQYPKKKQNKKINFWTPCLYREPVFPTTNRTSVTSLSSFPPCCPWTSTSTRDSCSNKSQCLVQAICRSKVSVVLKKDLEWFDNENVDYFPFTIISFFKDLTSFKGYYEMNFILTQLLWDIFYFFCRGGVH